MNTKDDDTLPLAGLSEEFSADMSIDEDFIPTTQPESSDGSKASKNSDSNYNKPMEELKTSQCNSGSSTLFSTHSESTLSLDTRTDQAPPSEDKSVDFIPGTETKKMVVVQATEDFSCKKILPLFDTEEHKDQGKTFWDTDVSGSPALDNQSFSIIMDTPIKMPFCNQESVVKKEESVSEILVNDSSETVDLEQTPVELKKSRSEVVEEMSDVSCSLNSNTGRCEETQTFDYSSVLLLDHSCSEKSEKFNDVTQEKSYLQETADDNLQNDNIGSSTITKLSKQETSESAPTLNGNISPEQDIPPTTAEQNNSSIVYRKIDFKLSVCCIVTVNTKTNSVLRKNILSVDEIPASKQQPASFEPASDNVTDKSKRYSTSSSGSVYSDKTGLPFALPKRVSAVSDQTDSSEDEFGHSLRKDRRIPWSNEYLLPLKMDDIMKVYIENPELLKRPNIISSPGKPKSRRGGRVNHLKEILESSSSERTSTPVLEISESQPVKTNRSKESLEKEGSENSTRVPVADEKKQSGENEETGAQNEDDINGRSVQCCDIEKQTASEEHESKLQDSMNDMVRVKRHSGEKQKNSPVALSEGLSVLARWTDRRYYSGVLSGNTKSSTWEVKFDDGASKTIREDLIIPTECLKEGALVFALTGNKYESGQIVDVKRGDGISYVVELDEAKKQVAVKISDLSMTDDMAGILREKYKPAGRTPRGGADIDCDNVLSGKRVREQRTPIKPRETLERGSSEGKRRSSSKSEKKVNDASRQVNETPQSKTKRGTRGLKSENGHLVEDKIISADSPSGNETGETTRERRRAAKPRSLSYAEATRPGKKASKSYLRSDGIPIPGTSGVKFKKKKIVSATGDAESPAAEETVPSGVRSSSKKKDTPSRVTRSTEKSTRKRKLDETVDDSALKTPQSDGRSRPKRKLRK